MADKIRLWYMMDGVSRIEEPLGWFLVADDEESGDNEEVHAQFHFVRDALHPEGYDRGPGIYYHHDQYTARQAEIIALIILKQWRIDNDE